MCICRWASLFYISEKTRRASEFSGLFKQRILEQRVKNKGCLFFCAGRLTVSKWTEMLTRAICRTQIFRVSQINKLSEGPGAPNAVIHLDNLSHSVCSPEENCVHVRDPEKDLCLSSGCEERSASGSKDKIWNLWNCTVPTHLWIWQMILSVKQNVKKIGMEKLKYIVKYFPVKL